MPCSLLNNQAPRIYTGLTDVAAARLIGQIMFQDVWR